MKCRILRHKFGLWIITALAFASCSQEELAEQGTTLPDGMYPMTFTAVQVAPENMPQTRVSDSENTSSWSVGDQIHVTVTQGNAKQETICTLDASGNITDYNPQLYWQNTDDVTVNAWYSNIEGQNTGTGNTVRFDNQSSGLAYVLKAEETTAKYTDRNIELKFSHQLAKIRVNLAGEKAGSVNDVKIESYTSCTNTNGTVSTDGATVGEITMYHLNGTNIYGANVVRGKTIEKFKLNGGSWVNLSATVTPEKAKVHEISITVNEKVTEVNLNNLTGPHTISSDGKYILTGSTTQRIIINADATVVLKGVSINTSSDGAPIQISGYHTATLMLEGNNNTIQSNVERYPAILPDQGSTVVIDGTGSLKAQGSFSAAGIGSGGIGQFAWETISAGYIKILGGSVEAIGGTGGTGIGCGYYGNCQGVEILGGTVTARAGGGYDNPAIGSSTAGSATCTYVKLERCTINAHPEGADVIVANSVTPDINNDDALHTAGVTLNVY